MAEELVVSFDNDAAGSDAAERAIDLAEANDFSVKVATFKDFKDAADAALADPENIRRVVGRRRSCAGILFRKNICRMALAKNSAALATREGLHDLRAILAKLKNIASPVERDFWMKELAKRTGDEGRRYLKAGSGEGECDDACAATTKKRGGAEARSVSRARSCWRKIIFRSWTKNDFGILDDCVNFLIRRKTKFSRF